MDTTSSSSINALARVCCRTPVDAIDRYVPEEEGEEAVWCPICRRGQLKQSHRIIFCSHQPCGLRLDTKVSSSVPTKVGLLTFLLTASLLCHDPARRGQPLLRPPPLGRNDHATLVRVASPFSLYLFCLIVS